LLVSIFYSRRSLQASFPVFFHQSSLHKGVEAENDDYGDRSGNEDNEECDENNEYSGTHTKNSRLVLEGDIWQRFSGHRGGFRWDRFLSNVD
jgi:hypothetical protein